MNHFSINGIERDFPVSSETSFGDLLKQVRSTCNSDQALVSSIRINGLEISAVDEAALAGVPMSALESVEVLTSHPREFAEDTLQSLLQFTAHIEKASIATADLAWDPTYQQNLDALIENVQTFTDAVTQVKQILRVGVLQTVNVLEADLLSIFKDILHYQQVGNTHYVADLLRHHLPANIVQWRTEGLPALIRSRDS